MDEHTQAVIDQLDAARAARLHRIADAVTASNAADVRARGLMLNRPTREESA